MTVHQISIFCRDEVGTLLRVLDFVQRSRCPVDCFHHIRHRGIWHLPYYLFRTYTGIRSVAGGRHFGQHVGSVAITLDNRPGRAADAVRVITGEG